MSGSERPRENGPEEFQAGVPVEIKKRRLSYWGGALKEAGILVAVFGPMYMRFEKHAAETNIFYDSVLWASCGIVLIGIGIELERRF